LPSFPSTTLGFFTPGNATGATATVSFSFKSRVSSAMFPRKIVHQQQKQQKMSSPQCFVIVSSKAVYSGKAWQGPDFPRHPAFDMGFHFQPHRYRRQAHIFKSILTHNEHIMTTSTSCSEKGIPIFLLKTRSIPHDGYEEKFSTSQFVPEFVPVLEHRMIEEGLDVVKELLGNKRIGAGQDRKYGGMIFTSQRAVEAFAKLVDEGKGQLQPNGARNGT